MKISIIKYNAGNIQSVVFALNRMGIDPLVTNDATELMSSDKIIFPGVGEASSSMNSLKNNHLDLLIPQFRQPVLGICVGLQLMCDYSEEGNTKGLGIFPTRVKKFAGLPPGYKIPHMGWNTVTQLSSRLYEGIPEHTYVYYVHSYRADVCEFTVATSTYGEAFSAGLAKENFYAVQYHTEKSADMGAKMLENFIKYC